VNQTLEISLLALIIPAAALMVCLYIERRNNVSTGGMLEPSEGPGVRPKFKLIPSREQRLIAKTPTDVLLQVRQRTDTKTLKR
jgi:hypothetical protein